MLCLTFFHYLMSIKRKKTRVPNDIADYTIFYYFYYPLAAFVPLLTRLFINAALFIYVSYTQILQKERDYLDISKMEIRKFIIVLNYINSITCCIEVFTFAE